MLKDANATLKRQSGSQLRKTLRCSKHHFEDVHVVVNQQRNFLHTCDRAYTGLDASNIGWSKEKTNTRLTGAQKRHHLRLHLIQNEPVSDDIICTTGDQKCPNMILCTQ